jgi:hypothetical protein
MEEIIKKYLKEHLSIELDEEGYGFNGLYVVVKLLIDDEIISECSYALKQDEGWTNEILFL